MKVIGVGGYARSGKDAFVSIAKNILTKNGYFPTRIGFADNLKREIDGMLKFNNFNLDVFTTDPETKTKLRPLLVWWGCARRDLSNGGLYWVDQVDSELHEMETLYSNRGEKMNSDRVVVLISDVRFPNEAEWLQKKWAGEFIHLRRFSNKEVRDGYGDWITTEVFDPAPNEEEAKNDPLIQKMANVKVEWESRGIAPGSCVTEDDYLQQKVLEALNSTKFFKHTTSGILSV